MKTPELKDSPEIAPPVKKWGGARPRSGRVKGQPVKPKKVRGQWGGKRAGAGKPEYTFTEEQRQMVSLMAGGGVVHTDIALLIKPEGAAFDADSIDVQTLEKHFAFELKVGKVKLDSICIGGLAKAMMRGEGWAVCFYAKTRLGKDRDAGWRERADNSATDPSQNDGLKELAAAIRSSPGDDMPTSTPTVQ